MYEFKPENNLAHDATAPDSYERRNGAERRIKPACGFACISTVGWICRREQFRRSDDPDTFGEHDS